MQLYTLPIAETGYFSKLICDYVGQSPQLASFYNRYPEIKGFKAQMQEKQAFFTEDKRQVLVTALQGQYAKVAHSEEVKANISALGNSNTFTVVTGHQLNLFTGPLYFLYKIIHTLNSCEALKKAYPEADFVPVYWMATEDHDFDEINFFKLNGKKIQWNRADGGPVGRFDTQGLEAVLGVLEAELGPGKHAQALKELFRKAYLEHDNLTSATRYLVNQLFGDYGLVIVDGDDSVLKSELVPYIKQDLEKRLSFTQVSETAARLKQVDPDYVVQVNPREINYFYIEDGLRERILYEGDGFKVNNTDVTWTKDELWEAIDTHPERFSPNVICRPLYQEVVLPNLCYIGGGGELAYWFELKAFFESMQVPFPMLMLRNSVLVSDTKAYDKLKKLGVGVSEMFLKKNHLINRKIREISNIEIDLGPQKKLIESQFAALHELAQQTDASFLGAVQAQERKQIKGLEHLEKRLLKAQKRKLADQVQRLAEAQNVLFPEGSLQERNQNFSEQYLRYGPELIPALKSVQKPFESDFIVMVR